MSIRLVLSKFFTATIVLLLLVVVPLSSVQAAGTIYVRPDGDDTNCDGTADVAYPGSGGPGLVCAVKTIQKGVDLVDTGGTVTVAAGIYTENVVVNKASEISGAGAATTIIYPAVSNPACAGSLCGSNIFLVQASDVAIRGFTLDGDNPVIVSGIVVGGADIDARNGVVEDFSLGVFDNLEVAETIIQNIYFRGIYASSGGTGFDIHDNLVQNVRGDTAQGNAIMNWAGSGMIQDNTIIDASDGIVSNHSSGTQYLHNTVRNTPVGIHSDNNGSYGGIGDVIHGNVIEDCSTNGYGLWVFASRLNNSVDGNTITNCSVGMAMAGQYAAVTTAFTNNVLDGENLSGATGIYETTSIWGYGSGNVSASFTNNVVTNYETATNFETDPTYTLSATFLHNSITNYTDGVVATGTGTYSVDGTCNWWGGRAGMTTSDPLETGMTFAPWLVYGTDGSTDAGFQLPTSFTVTPPGDVSAAENDFTTLDNAIACAVDGQTIDINGPYTWASSNPLANTAYLASYADTDYGDIRGLEIPEGVDDLTITSSLGTGHILGVGDVDDSGTIIFSSFLFGEDAPGNTNLTIENLLIEDFEGAITLGWNAVGSYSGTMIQNNEIVLAGDNSDDSDWMQNIAFYFWVGANQTIQNNIVTFQADGLHTGTSTSASFGFQSGTSGSGYDGLVIDGNIFQVGDTSNGTEEIFGIWENSHTDGVGTTIHLTNNQFLGRAGDDFDHAFRLTSQTDGLLISGNILDRVDEVFMAMKTSYHTDGDHYAFTGNTLTNVGGADGIFLDNLTYNDTPFDIPIYWDISNTIDGETGIRGLNELSTDATHAVRPSSGATVIESVFITPTAVTPVFVDAGWTGVNRFSDPDGISTGNLLAYGYNSFDTIQAGVDAVTSGGVVNVAAGIYEENVVVNKIVSILGAGSGNTASDTIVTSPTSVDYKVGVFQITATGNSGAIILLSDMQVQPIGQAGVSIGRFTESTGTSVAYLTLDNLFVIGTNNNAQTEQERGLYVDLTSTLDHLTIVDSAFNNLAYGWYFQKAVSADTSTVSNVSVTNTTFNHNNLKGLYTEKLTEASFIDCTISENGFDGTGLPSYFIPWMTGVDLNLKAGTYQNIAFIDSDFTNNALGGAQHGVGLTLKARDDGATYGAFPATLDGVVISGGNFVGNERGIRIGEPGKNNAGPTNVAILLNRIFANEQTYIGSDGSAYGGIINYSLAAVAAENNWWGCNEGPTADGSTDCDLFFGTVDPNPWLILESETGPAAGDLFFSEYIEGSGFYKVLEIFNGTGLTVDLHDYQVALYSNGATSPTVTYIWPAGTYLANGDVHVIANTQADPAVLAIADTANNVVNHNGDDAVALRKASDNTLVDVIGQIGYRPGIGYWGTEPITTRDHTLVRADSLMSGDPIGSDIFDPADEWISYATNTITYLGFHTTDWGPDIDISETTTTISTLITNSDAVDTSPMGFVSDGILMDYTAENGTMTPASDPTLNGLTSSVYDPTVEGNNDVCVTLDNEQLCTTILVTDEAGALAWLQANMDLSGTSLASVTATFPASIPPVIVDLPYTINSRMTLGQALPAGTTVSILATVDGVGPFPYVTDVLIPGTTFWITDLAGGSASPFDANYGGKVEIYSITLTNGGGNPLAIDTTVLIESIISKDNFVTPVVLDSLSLPVHLDADVMPSTTTVDCGSGSPVVTYGDSITCVATVSASAGPNTPGGTVAWTTDVSGIFATSPCTLSGAGGVSTCSVSYTPNLVSTGFHLITATYSGDTAFTGSTGGQTLTVNKRAITVTADAMTKLIGTVDPTFTYAITAGSLAFSDAFTGTLSRDPGETAGMYAITIGSLALTEDYELTFVGDYLTIYLYRFFLPIIVRP